MGNVLERTFAGVTSVWARRVINQIDWWFCCLNPRERVVLRDTCEGLALTLFTGVPLTVWEAFWVTSPNNAEAIREAFLHIYRLEIATIVVDDVETTVVRPVSGASALWTSWVLFMVTPSAACTDGCQQSRVP